MRDGDTGRDPLDGFVERLRAMPASDPRARAAILARVRGRRPAPWRATLAFMWQPSVPVLAAASLVAAAIGVGYGARVMVEPSRTVVASDAPVNTAAVPVADIDPESRPIMTQFVFEAHEATRVAIVGDFNGWNRSSPLAVMHDAAKRGVWETTVPLTPGRHTYAFLVNDSLLTLDPRAPATVDPDFGRSSSVVLVTR